MAQEIGVADRLGCVRSVVAMAKPNAELMHENPLSKIPTLVLDDGTVLYDSPVICEYLDGLHNGNKMHPADSAQRLTALRRQALGDGMLDTLILWRNELSRPAEQQGEPYLSAFALKTRSALDALESEAAALSASAFGIGHIAIGCALSYLDFRFALEDWRASRPAISTWHAAFNERPSVKAVPIVDDE